jgi:hypothetical protein
MINYLKLHSIVFTKRKRLGREYVLATIINSLDALKDTLAVGVFKGLPNLALDSRWGAWGVECNIIVVNVAVDEVGYFKEIGTYTDGLTHFTGTRALDEFCKINRH